MWRRPASRVRDVLMGLLIGLGVAGVLVRWSNDNDCNKKMSVKRYNAGERSFVHLVKGTYLGNDNPTSFCSVLSCEAGIFISSSK